MKGKHFTLAGRKCFEYGDEQPQVLLIRPDGGKEQAPEKQPELISSLSGAQFLYLSFRVDDWNGELSPWRADPVFGRDAFGDGAEDTLSFIEKKLLPYAVEGFGLSAKVPVVIGGYSLAALFALWCTYRTYTFAAVAAASPSVWFPGWIEYARGHFPRADCIYLSLGDREEKARSRILASVGDCIREQNRLLEESGVRCALEWNPGSHFMEPELRCAKAFAWCMSELKEQSYGDNGNILPC